MLGNFIIRILVLAFGYAYPAFECFKTVEKNKIDIEELRFWCQYWMLVASFTVCERIGDIFVSWVPMYGEMKLAFFIYLWYPKTKGTLYVYETALKPYLAKHETDIDRKLQEVKSRAWDFAIYYGQNWTKLGQTTFSQVLQYLAAQSGKLTTNVEKANDSTTSAPPSPSEDESNSSKSSKRPRPPLSPGSSTINRAVSASPRSTRVQVQPYGQTESLETVDTDNSGPEEAAAAAGDVNDKLQRARMRLRRAKQIHN